MSFERWDVVTALFPFVDVPVRKPRPILVLSTAGFNQDHGHLIGAMITTGARSSWPSDQPIQDLASAGLRHASVLRLKLFTLPVEAAARRIGALSEPDLSRIAAALATALPR